MTEFKCETKTYVDVDKLVKERDELRAKHNNVCTEHTATMVHNAELLKEVEKLTKERDQLRERGAEVWNKRENLRNEIADAREKIFEAICSDYPTLKQGVNALIESCDEARKERDAYKARNVELLGEFDELGKTVVAMRGQKERLAADVKNLRNLEEALITMMNEGDVYQALKSEGITGAVRYLLDNQKELNELRKENDSVGRRFAKERVAWLRSLKQLDAVAKALGAEDCAHDALADYAEREIASLKGQLADARDNVQKAHAGAAAMVAGIRDACGRPEWSADVDDVVGSVKKAISQCINEHISKETRVHHQDRLMAFEALREIAEAVDYSFDDLRKRQHTSGVARAVRKMVRELEEAERELKEFDSIIKEISDIETINSAIDCGHHGLPGVVRRVIGDLQLRLVQAEQKADKPNRFEQAVNKAAEAYGMAVDIKLGNSAIVPAETGVARDLLDAERRIGTLIDMFEYVLQKG